jgi:CheY-like chemotaxis protein
VGQRVLVVDDNPVSREILVNQLQAWGVAIETEARDDRVLAMLRYAGKTGPRFAAVVFNDPVHCVDDLGIIRQVRNDALLPDLRIVLIASSRTHGFEHVALNGEVGAVLGKPWSPSILYEALTGTVPSGIAAETAQSSEVKQEAMEPPVGTGLRVLVAEDNKVNQAVVKLMLEKLGCRVDIVANGLEAVEAVRLAPYDVVFMDVQMPEMDGLAATAAIRGSNLPDRRDVWITALTANAFEDDYRRCLAVGMNDLVAKPLKPANLKAALARVPAKARDGGAPAVAAAD